MTTTNKALRAAYLLRDRLEQRFKGVLDSVLLSYDTDQNPLITVSDGTPATGEQVIVVKFRPIEWDLAVNAVGLQSNIYTPHVIQIALEESLVADIPYLTGANWVRLMAELGQYGSEIQLYLEANGNPPDAGTITGDPAVTVQPHATAGMMAGV